MPCLMRVCWGGGVWFSVLCNWLQRFLVSLFVEVGVCATPSGMCKLWRTEIVDGIWCSGLCVSVL